MPLRSRAIYQPHGEVGTKLWLIVPLRLYVGIYFVIAAISKVAGHWFSEPEKLIRLLGDSIDGEAYPYGIYRAFFHGIIKPNAWLFTFLVIFGELLVGIAIATGTFTRLACLAGIFMMANFFLAFDVGLAQPHSTTSFALIMLVLMGTGAGRTYGVDHYLEGKVSSLLV